MRFTTTLPKGCIVKAGDIPVEIQSSVEVKSDTPIIVEIVSGIGTVVRADNRSIDSINNDPDNIYHLSKKHVEGC